MKIEKLIEKLLSCPIEMHYKDVKRILEHEGWTLDRTTKHYVFTNNGGTIVLPVHKGIVKKIYLKEEIIKKLNLEEKYGKK